MQPKPEVLPGAEEMLAYFCEHFSIDPEDVAALTEESFVVLIKASAALSGELLDDSLECLFRSVHQLATQKANAAL